MMQYLARSAARHVRKIELRRATVIILSVFSVLAGPLPARATPGSRANPAPALRVCAGDRATPPLLYWENGNASEQAMTTVKGYSVDVLLRTVQDLHWPAPSLRLLPLTRCLREAEQGRYDLVLDTGGDAESASFLSSDAYLTLHSVYFFSQKNHPSGLDIRTLSDLGRYRLCGLRGHSPGRWNFPLRQADFGSPDYRSLLNKLQADRCDVFVSQREILAGIYMHDYVLQRLFVSPDADMEPLPEATHPSLHFLLGRHVNDAPRRVRDINAELSQLRKAHVLDEIMGWYIR